jgi:hypothetical protein
MRLWSPPQGEPGNEAAAACAPEEAFSRCIGRLQQIIEAETLVLKEGRKPDFDALNQRKTHALLELIQVSRGAPPQSVGHAAERIGRLQRLLAENTQLLERRLQATQEIANLIVHHMRERESDGTYSIRSPGMRMK